MSTSFVDYARITVKGGDGGNGLVSFRHEKFVPHGGPNGGDGGHGGSIWLEATAHMVTLIDLKLRPNLRAGRGDHGQGYNKSGRQGESLVIKVPLGTIVSAEDGTPLADLTHEGERFEAAAGGRGGQGNQHFATPTNQAPRKATPGTPGKQRSLILELKLIAQVGLVGLPNAGKSTLLAGLTHATPRIAPYPFTTLHPNLGVMEADDFRRVTVADIPGLIEGAWSGAGLGDRFLRHIERTGLLVHLVDVSENQSAESDAADRYELVRRELETYSEKLASKPSLVALSKIDLLTPEQIEIHLSALRELGLEPLAISAETGQGTDALRAAILERLDTLGMIPDVS